MAAIYKAVQISLDRVVAIKILHGHLAQDKSFITRFEREAKAAANLKHENIVNIIDYGKADDIYFIAMEYVDGTSLKDLMNTIEFIPIDMALAITREISKGLAHAHERGVVHRDIKPANILIGYDGVIKIADFGLAQAQDLTSVTVTGSIVGTPAYMSPEQAGGKKVGTQTDVFSLGVVAYEMITGIKPFAGENYSSVIHQILTVKPRPAIQANPLVSREINDILEKMLEKDTEIRYGSIAAVSSDIEGFCRQKNIAVSRQEIGAFVKAPTEHFDRHRQIRKDKHFERGVYFAGLGKEKIDDAINEFSKVVHLDPSNKRAQKHLATLREKQAKVGAAAPKGAVTKKTKKSRRISLPVMVMLGIVIIGIVAFAVTRLFRSPGQKVQDSTVSTGFLDVRSTPSGAMIVLDDSTLGRTTPAHIENITAARHTVRIVLAGYQTYVDSFLLGTGETLLVQTMLEPAEEPTHYGSMDIRSKPSGAQVFLDNRKQAATTPCTIDSVETGNHTVRLVKKGYEPVEIQRYVDAGESVHISSTLTKTKKTPVIQAPAHLKISVNPWAKIYVDGKYLETTPVAGALDIPAGRHIVKLENPNFKVWQKTIDFKAGKTENLTVRLEPLDGFLKLTVRPWADVYIDGKFYETTPIAEPIRLASGRHTLKLINPSFQPYVQEIEIPVEKMLKKHVELVPK
ncbi:MAG: serine/threonine protein kinase [candidate division WOR-3 bacterium]|nr:MAG: serine/threonine protein kinase [candidate division WOR-3 bacterium]